MSPTSYRTAPPRVMRPCRRPVGAAQRCETPNCSTRSCIRQAGPDRKQGSGSRTSPKRERANQTSSHAVGPSPRTGSATRTDGLPLQRADDAQRHHQEDQHHGRRRRHRRPIHNHRNQLAHLWSVGRISLPTTGQEPRPPEIYAIARTGGTGCALPRWRIHPRRRLSSRGHQTVRYRASSA